MTTNAPDPYPASEPAAPMEGQTPEARPGAMPIDHERFFLIPVIDAAMNVAKKGLSADLVRQSCRWAVFVGMWALLAFAALLLVFGLIQAVEARHIAPLGIAVGAALLVCALLYTAGKFCNAGSAVIDSTPSELSSGSFLDCVALLAALLAIITLVGGIIAGIETGQMTPVGVGFGLGAFWAYLATVALSPAIVNSTVRAGASAGQELLGILSFFLKAILRIVPIAFGVGAAIGTVLFAIGIVRLLAASDDLERMHGTMQMGELMSFVIFAAALPFLAYIVVLVVYLLVDLARAVLRIPS